MGPSGSRRAWLLLTAGSLMFAGFVAYHLSPAAIVPLLAERFDLGKADAGLAISAVYIGWVAFQLPSGFLMDRYDNRRLLLGATLVFVGATVAGQFTSTYLEFLVIRAIGGLSGGIFFATNTTLIGQVFPDDRRGTAVGLFVASGPAGIVLGQGSAPFLVELMGWQRIFLVYAALSVVGYVLFRLSIGGPVRSGNTITVREFVKALSDRSVLLVSLAAFCSNAMWLFLTSWMPTYGVEVLSLPLSQVGLVASLAPLAGTVGRGSGGWVSDLVGQRRRPVIIASFLLVLPALIVVAGVESLLGFGGALLLAGFVLQLSAGVYFVYVSELVDPEVSGTSLSVIAVFVILGGLTAPVLGGWLIETSSWLIAFGCFGLVVLAGVGIILAMPET